jgi:HEAT repeat protein
MRKATAFCLAFLFLGCGGKNTSDWLQQLQQGDAAQRLEAIHHLGRQQTVDAEVVKALTAALKDDNSFVRRDAAATLAKFGPEARAAVPSLLVARRDRQRSVRRAAEAALARIMPQTTGGPRPEPAAKRKP